MSTIWKVVNIKKIIFSLLSVLLFTLLLGCSNNQQENLLSTKDNNVSDYAHDRKEISDDNNQDENKYSSKKVTKKILDVPLIKQNPELKYGCEVTSLTMVLQYAGHDVDKLTLAKELSKDNDQLIVENGDIKEWGDPDKGFVGEMSGKEKGYAVFDKPVENLMNKYLGNGSKNLTGEEFEVLIKEIDNNKPVIVWTTGDYKMPDRWESWFHGRKKIKTPLDLHVVVLVGYDNKNVYINDPLSGEKAKKVDKKTFISSWEALKRRALSYN